MKTQLFILFFLLTLLSTVSAQIAIDSFSADSVQPGEELELKMTLENVGDEDIQNILVSIDLTDLPFAPRESSSEQIIEEIEEDEQESLSFQLQALSTAQANIYNIPVTISYENTTKDSVVSIEVYTEASIEVLVENQEILMQNEQGKVTVKIINTGLTQIQFVQLSLKESSDYEILSSSTAYIGDIDSADFETEDFTIIPLKKNTELEIEVEYRDAKNEIFTENQEIALTIYTEEQAQELGLTEPSHSLTWTLILFAVVIIIIVLWRRKRKKKHDY